MIDFGATYDVVDSLEGNPVEPDVFVERPLPYCNGADPQLEAGYAALDPVWRSSPIIPTSR